MTEKRHLVKAAGLVGSATLLSRLLGFIRDILIAGFFGTSMAAQAFVVAFRIPNLLRDIVGEGAANAAFVPVLTEYLATKTKKEFWELVLILLNILFVALVALTAAGIFFAPFIVRIIAPGFISDPQKLALTIKLTRMMFPYILIIGLTAYVIGTLNSLKHFTMPAMGPAVLNICLISSMLLLRNVSYEPVMALAAGVLIGGLAQFSINIPVLIKKGFRLRPPHPNPSTPLGTVRGVVSLSNRPLPKGERGLSVAIWLRGKFSHPAARKIGRLLLPRALGSCVYQANVFIDTILASLAFIVGEGGVAALYYSNRLIQLPLAIFGVAMATVALPSMSEFAAKKDLDGLKKTLAFSLRTVFYIMTPAAVGLFVLGRSIVWVLFQRGEFTAYSTSITSSALLYYTFGLFAYAGIKILVSCFYSMQDTATPVKIASFSLIVNFVLNIILMYPLKIGGLALATSISATGNFLLLFMILRRRIGRIGVRDFLIPSLKILLAGFLMGLFCFGLSSQLLFEAAVGTCQGVLRLLFLIVSSMGVFYVLTFAFGVEEASQIRRWISKRR